MSHDWNNTINAVRLYDRAARYSMKLIILPITIEQAISACQISNDMYSRQGVTMEFAFFDAKKSRIAPTSRSMICQQTNDFVIYNDANAAFFRLYS